MPSTVVKGSSYDPNTKILQVTFVSGLVYNYLEVPEEEYKKMITSGAKGIYLNKFIKGKYEYEKVRSEK